MTRNEILAEMGFTVWRLRRSGESTAPAAMTGEAEVVVAEPATDQGPPSRAGSGEGPAWEVLEAEIRACRACGLCAQRKQAVPGVGDRRADWLFIGEGPGAEEDERGEPFVGQAGRLLDAMLASIGLRRGENVYIANAVKCRPPGNRTPEESEMAACRPFLERQIALLEPKLIVLLGRAAMQTMLGETRSLAAMRGKVHRANGVPAIVTYHPAYLLRTLADKAKAWEDLCLMRRTMRDPS